MSNDTGIVIAKAHNLFFVSTVHGFSNFNPEKLNVDSFLTNISKDNDFRIDVESARVLALELEDIFLYEMGTYPEHGIVNVDLTVYIGKR